MKKVWSDHIDLLFQWLLWVLILLLHLHLIMPLYDQYLLQIHSISKSRIIPSWLWSLCCRLHPYYGVLSHSFTHSRFFLVWVSFTVPAQLHLCSSLQDLSKSILVLRDTMMPLGSQVWMCALVPFALGQHLSIYQLPLCLSLHYFAQHRNRYSCTARSFDPHWWAFCMGQAQLKTFSLCSDCKRKTLTNRLGLACGFPDS